MRFTVRDYRHEDFDRLWEIDQLCFPPEISYSRAELSLYLRRSGSFTVVAEAVPERGDAGTGVGEQSASGLPETVGFITAEARRRVGHIITIDVLEPARHSGIGSELLRSAEKRLQLAGCPSVFLETAVDNRPALAFYKRHNYFLTKTMPRYYSNGVDAFVLKKDLPPSPKGS